MNKKVFAATKQKSFDIEGQASAIISTPAVDRDSDRLIPSGVQLANYNRNRSVLYAHDHYGLPVGKDAVISVTPNDVRAKWSWLENDDFAGRVRNAWDQGALSAVSVGFLPLEYEENDFGGLDFKKWELLEFSIVAVPANPEAVALRTIKSLNDDLQRRQGRHDDEVILRIIDDDDVIVTAGGRNFTRKDIRAMAEGSIRDRLKSIREPTLDEKLKAKIGVTKNELAEIIKLNCQELMTALTGRVY